MEFVVDNVNQALAHAARVIQKGQVRRESRNGPVTMFHEPVTTIYHRPCERVLFDEVRDANPFFHFFESLWMLDGRADVDFVYRFVKRMADFSDNGSEFNGAYGRRWRSWFGRDQIEEVILSLSENKDDRRCVIQMWDARHDLRLASKDVPCNTQLYVWVSHDGKVDMSILCRSNDMIMGAYGANAVHFSFLLEYIARSLGREVGRLFQFSNNLHMYDADAHKIAGALKSWGRDPYTFGQVRPYPIMDNGDDGEMAAAVWRNDLSVFMDSGPITGFRDPFFRKVVTPLWNAHEAYKKAGDPDRFAKALEILEQCQATDWRLAAEQWIERRMNKHLAKETA